MKAEIKIVEIDVDNNQIIINILNDDYDLSDYEVKKKNYWSITLIVIFLKKFYLHLLTL